MYKRGKIWYYRLPGDLKRVGHSTGQKLKYKATEYIEAMLNIGSTDIPTLGEYARNMFIWGKSDYLKRRSELKQGRRIGVETAELRLGHVNKYLIPQKMSATDLKGVVSSKSLSVDFVQALAVKQDDLTIVLTGTISDFSFRATIGPMTRTELRGFLEYNAEHHLEPLTREVELAEILATKPEVSLYIDLDLYRLEDSISLDEILPTYERAAKEAQGFVDRTIKYMFKVDL